MTLCAGMALSAAAQQTVTIQGKVKFIDEGFKVQALPHFV